MRRLADRARPGAARPRARQRRGARAAARPGARPGWLHASGERDDDDDRERRSGARAAVGPFRRARAFQQLVRDALACAAREGWREIILSDADFRRLAAGRARRGRVAAGLVRQRAASCTLLARRYDEVVRRHARFVHLARDLGAHHRRARVPDRPTRWTCPAPSGARAGCCSGWTPSAATAYCGSEPERRLLLRENLQEWLRQSSPAFPATRWACSGRDLGIALKGFSR